MSLRNYIPLAKPRLNLLVIFSAGVSYLTATGLQSANWFVFVMLLIGGFFTTGSANGMNQAIEALSDKKMNRTQNRPIPSGLITVNQAWIASLTMLLIGVGALLFVNVITALLSLASALFYAFVYTPLKSKTSLAVLIGAIPGAIPPLLGWTAATGGFATYGWVLFSIQFFWQFPHFWAIAWVLHDDYVKAGLHLLPSEKGRNKLSASIIVVYCLLLVLVAYIPFAMNVAGVWYCIAATIVGILFVFATIQLWVKQSVEMARRAMFASFIYLPVVQLFLMFRK